MSFNSLKVSIHNSYIHVSIIVNYQKMCDYTSISEAVMLLSSCQWHRKSGSRGADSHGDSDVETHSVQIEGSLYGHSVHKC